MRRVIPLAARALGDRFGRLFERSIAESTPRGSKADLDETIGFVEAPGRWAGDARPPWIVDLACDELVWRQAMRECRRPIARASRFPVARLGPGGEARAAAIADRPTLAIWWRPTPPGRVQHLILSMPRLGFGLPSRSGAPPEVDSRAESDERPE